MSTAVNFYKLANQYFGALDVTLAIEKPFIKLVNAVAYIDVSQSGVVKALNSRLGLLCPRKIPHTNDMIYRAVRESLHMQ